MSEASRWMPASACSTASLADRGGSRFRLLTVGRNHLYFFFFFFFFFKNHTAPVPRRIRAVLHGARSTSRRCHLTIVDATITAPIDGGERRLDISERELLTDTAAIHDGPEASQLGPRRPVPGGSAMATATPLAS